MAEVAVAVQDLEKKFGSFIAVDKISFEVPKGAIYGFLGPNGAGKSTTIRMLCGILLPTSGRGRVAGYDIYSQTEEIKSHIGYMSQKFSLYEDLTVEENIDFYSGIYRVPDHRKQERKEWVLRMAGLTDLRSVITAILPGGLKQRLALGCALLHEPPILFLDEPTSGVDPISRRQFWNLIYELSNQGVTIFVTTHYMDEAEYFDTISFIYSGKIIAQGTPEALKKEVMKDDVYDLDCDRPQDALFILKEVPNVKEVALFGKGLHVVLSEDGNRIKELTHLLEEKGIRVYSFQKVLPSLEDVFVSLIESYDENFNHSGKI